MKAQTSRSPEEPLNPGQQVTPVVVKSGGGGPDALPDTNLIIMDSDFMPFKDLTGDTWEQALSSSTGRIHELTLKDGDLQPVYCEILPDPNALTSLELKFAAPGGKELFTVSEVKDEHGSIRLQVQSGVNFRVVTSASRGGWTSSQGTFSNKLVKATFKQRQHGAEEDAVKFEYLFNNQTFALNVDFHVDV